MPDFYKEFEAIPIARPFPEYEDIARDVDRFAERHDSVDLAEVYQAGMQRTEILCRQSASIFTHANNSDIARLSYALGILSRHIYPVPASDDASGMRRTVVM